METLISSSAKLNQLSPEVSPYDKSSLTIGHLTNWCSRKFSGS